MVRLWKPLSIVAGLLLLLTYLLIQSRNPDLARRARMQEALQNLQLHDTELTRDVLLARAGLLPNYDSLPRIGQQLSQIADALRAESTTVSGAAAKEMGKHAEALTAALQQKLTLVEYFKSDNALLQNSLRYFTHTGQNIGKQFKAEQKWRQKSPPSRTYWCASYTRRNSARAKKQRQRSVVCQLTRACSQVSTR